MRINWSNVFLILGAVLIIALFITGGGAIGQSIEKLVGVVVGFAEDDPLYALIALMTVLITIVGLARLVSNIVNKDVGGGQR